NRLTEIEGEMSQDNFWDNRDYAQKLVDESSSLKRRIEPLLKAETQHTDMRTMLELADGEDETTQKDIQTDLAADLAKFTGRLQVLELELMLDGPHDRSNCIFSINAGAGGTESCDWASMLLRMYQRWGEARGWQIEISELLPGEVAGIKSATIQINADFAYGYLKAERGVHRLVRISPFDSAKRRHTSFVALDVVAEVADDIEVEILDEDLRVDTYRSSGAGGQHVNTTDSAVRITHLPTGIVVACQAERSQHKNRAKAMKVLRARVYEWTLDQTRKDMEKFYGEKGEIAWGSQIRSYVLQPYTMVKDHRTSEETSNVNAVLNGAIQPFIEAYLKKEAAEG
ncbi:MAG: peptide chain release factor 2, partial [Verrucomicrobia bacterium]|nr:peptide chain release factor 2 [Verrucomicrobiota bacterium]